MFFTYAAVVLWTSLFIVIRNMQYGFRLCYDNSVNNEYCIICYYVSVLEYLGKCVHVGVRQGS